MGHFVKSYVSREACSVEVLTGLGSGWNMQLRGTLLLSSTSVEQPQISTVCVGVFSCISSFIMVSPLQSYISFTQKPRNRL